MSFLLQISTGSGWDVPTMTSAVSQAMNWTVVVGAFLATTFISVKFAWEYFKYSLGAAQGNDVSVVWDWQEIVRVVFILVLLGSYKPLAEGITGAMRNINSITQVGSDANSEMVKAANKHYLASNKDLIQADYDKYKAAVDKVQDPVEKKKLEKILATDFYKKWAGQMDGTPDGSEENVYDQFQDGIENMTGQNGMGSMISQAFTGAMTGLLSLLASIIKWVVGTFIKMVFQIGIIFGPLVLAFGIFFKDKPIQYMNQMLTLGLVFTTLNILDTLTTHFMVHAFAEPSAKEAVAFNLAMIGAYLSAFKITNLFVGQTGINSIMGRGLGVAGGAVAGALAVGGAVATGGASKAAMGAASKGVQSSTRQRVD